MMCENDDIDFDLLTGKPANDNAALSVLDARLLGHILKLLTDNSAGFIEREFFDELSRLEPSALPADINGAIMDARRAELVVLRAGKLHLERRLTQRQIWSIRRLVKELSKDRR